MVKGETERERERESEANICTWRATNKNNFSLSSNNKTVFKVNV